MAAPRRSDAIELRPLPPSSPPQSLQTVAQDPVHDAPPSNTQTLPSVDGGKAAWRLLLAAFVFEALLWGFPLSFGVFQDYYSQLPQFKDSPYVAVVGTVASGMAYLSAPLAIPLVRKYSRYRRLMIYIGWPICVLSLLAGSFASSLSTLILTQGVLYGLGFVTFYYPILSMVNEYWVARRGLAYGLLCSASGLSGAVMPFLLQASLVRYGYATTLRGVAVALTVLTGPILPFLNGRLPESEVSGAAGRTDWTFLKMPQFWIYSLSNLAMGLGYFFPSLYLPSFATSNGLGGRQGAVSLALMSISQVLGQLTFGYLSDRSTLPLNLLAATSTLVASTAVFTAWGLAHSLPLLVVFAIVFGFFGAGYTAMWARMGTSISSDPSAAFAVFGLLNFGKGVGNVLAGPIGGALVMRMASVEGYGSGRYEQVVLFTGSCLLVSAAVIPLGCLRAFSHA